MRIETDTINREKTKFLLKAFLFLSIIIFSMVCSAFRVGAQNPSLWVGEKKKLIKLSSVTGQRFLEISMKHLEDIAVDNYREVVWVGTRKEIIQYGFDGAEHFRYPLKIEGHSKGKDDDDGDRKEGCLGEDDEEGDATCHGGEHLVRLSLDPFDGSLWIGSKDEVIKIAFDGSERFKLKLSGHVQDISVDPSNGSSWVGLKREAKKYNSEGRSLLSFYIGKGENLQAISVDPLSRSLWIGTKKRVFEVDEQGVEIFQDEERTDTQDIAVDTFDPSLWGVGKKKFFKYSGPGVLLFDAKPCSKHEAYEDEAEHHDDDQNDKDMTCKGNLITLAVDSSDGSGWVAWRKSLLKLSPSGLPLFWLDGFKQIQAIDIGLPKVGIQITDPSEGSLTSIPSVRVKGSISDPAAKVVVNGVEAAVSGLSFESQNVPLHPGSNMLTAIATNRAGLSASDTLEVIFRPPLSVQITAPTSGDRSDLSRIDVEGIVSGMNVQITVNGIAALVSGGRFSAADVPLTLGMNQIKAVARDESGFEESDTIKVRYDWLDLSITSPLPGTLFSSSKIEVKGFVSDTKAVVGVNGVGAVVHPDGSFTAAFVPIQEGDNVITAQGTNHSGQSDADRVIVTYSPELPPLNVTVLTPVDGSILDTPRFELNGHVSDPDASVLVNDIPARVEEGFFNATVFSCVPPGPLAMQFEGEEPGEPLPPGACTITVRAYSRNGETASQVINVTFVPSETPLSVVIIDPTRDRVFTHSPIEITGRITDILSGFTPTAITVNGIPGVVQGETFSAFIPLTDGINDISVHAENLVGIDAYDRSRVIYEPPTSALTLLVTSPVDPFIVNHSPITVSGLISDSTAIVDVNGSTAAQDFRSFKVPSLPLSIGQNTLTVTAVRPNNETVTASLSVIYDPNAPSPPPPVLSPLPAFLGKKVTIANGATFLDRGLDVSGLSGPFFEVEVVVNGVIYPKVQADDTGFFKTTVLLFEDGPYHISARTIDLSGNMSALSDEQVVIKDTTAPRIFARVHGRRIGLAASQVEINGFTEPFTDVAISIFNVFPKNIKLVSDARGHFSTLTHMNAGEHFVSIAATDRAGNTGRNSKDFWTIHPTRSVALSAVPIAPMIDPLPSPTNASRISISGNAYRDAHLEIYRNNMLVGTVITDQRGRFHFENLPLLPGTNILKLKQEKYRFGRHGGLLFFEPPDRFLDPVDSPEVIVEVITETPVRPEVAITFPPDGAVTNGAFLPLRGTVSDPRAEIRVSPTYLLGGKAQNRGGSFVSEGKIPLIPGKNVLWVEAIAPDGSRSSDKVTVFSDRDAEVPSIHLTSPVDGEETFDPFISTNGTIDDSVQTVIVNEVDAVITGSGFTSNFIDLTKWHYMVNLSDLNRKGNALINAWAMDAQGRIGAGEGSVFFRDLPVPQIFLSAPLDGALLTVSPLTVNGQVFDASEVTVNGRSARIDGEFFTIQMDLVEGPNTFTVIARNPGKAATETITVEFQPAKALVSLEIVSSASQIPLGNALNLKAVGIRAGGGQVDLTQAVLWHSSAPTVALVNAAGFVTSLKAGGSTISAIFQGLSANLSLTVDSPALQSIRIAYEDPFLVQLTTGASSLQVGELRSMLALGTFSDGALIDLKKSFFPTTWISSDPAVATVDATGLVSALKAGITELRASSAGVTGRTNLVVTPPPMHLFITDPVAGGAATHDEITVSGIVITGAPEVGITINGLLANVFGDRFVVNGVPLDPGSNTLTAQAVDSNGAMSSAEVTVSSSPTTQGITLRSNISSGVAPLELSLSIDSTFGALFGSTLSFSGPAVPQINQISPEGYHVKLTTEGIYSFTAEVTDGQGTVHRGETTVVVLNFAEMDALLRGKWSDFKDALVNKNISKALENVVEESRPKYRRLFEQFGLALPEIATNLPELKFIRIVGDVAAYYVTKLENGVEKAHFIYFSRGSDGFWRLHKF